MTLAFLVAGCGGGIPKWVTKPPHSLTAGGISAETYDPAGMYKKAEEDARSRLSRVLDYKVQGVLRNWASSRKEAHMDETIAEGYFESISQGLTAMELPGVEVKEFYHDKKEHRMYALVALDLNRTLPDVKKLVKKKAQEHRLFNAKEDADAAFRELDAALEKAAIK